MYALIHTFLFICSEILTHEGRKRHCKAGHREKGKAFDFAIGSDPGHCHLAIRIDVRLNDHIGESDDRILQAGGNSDPDNFPDHHPVQTNASKTQSIHLIGPHQTPHRQESRQKLRDHRCKRCSRDSHPKARNQDKVQNNVQA